MTIEIETKGLDKAQALFRTAPEVAQRATELAVLDTSSFARRLSSTEIREEVNFKAGYLNEERLSVTKKANGFESEAVIRGRNRATSLAQFASTPVSFGRKKRGIRVKVARNGGDTLKNAFFVPLRNGNTGLAVRTKDGRPPSRGAVPIFKGAFLLYAPSVGQVFYDVASQVVDRVSDKLVNEFTRQFERLFK